MQLHQEQEVTRERKKESESAQESVGSAMPTSSMHAKTPNSLSYSFVRCFTEGAIGHRHWRPTINPLRPLRCLLPKAPTTLSCSPYRYNCLFVVIRSYLHVACMPKSPSYSFLSRLSDGALGHRYWRHTRTPFGTSLPPPKRINHPLPLDRLDTTLFCLSHLAYLPSP